MQFSLLGVAFYGTELLLSTPFGLLSDRLGHHRVMQFGPIFGAIAVVLTWATTDLLLLGGTRLLEGASTAASVPSILGFIAAVTAGNELLRGRAAARFEGATLAGLGVGLVTAGPLFVGIGGWGGLGRNAFLLNALIYVLSFCIYRFGVDPADEVVAKRAGTATRPTPPPARTAGWRAYPKLLRESSVLVLAPTWIALNAALGMWTTQSIFNLVRKPDPRFADQLLMGRSRTTRDQRRPWGGPGPVLRGARVLGRPVQADPADDDHLLRARRRCRHRGGGAGAQPQRRVAGPAPAATRVRRARRAVRPCRRDPGRPRVAGRYVGGSPGRSRRDHGPVQRVPGPRPDRRQPAGRDHRRDPWDSTGSWPGRSSCWPWPSPRSPAFAPSSTASSRSWPRTTDRGPARAPGPVAGPRRPVSSPANSGRSESPLAPRRSTRMSRVAIVTDFRIGPDPGGGRRRRDHRRTARGELRQRAVQGRRHPLDRGVLAARGGSYRLRARSRRACRGARGCARHATPGWRCEAPPRRGRGACSRGRVWQGKADSHATIPTRSRAR